MSVLNNNFEIEKIQGMKKDKNGLKYLIRWKNYSKKEQTWEREKDLIHDGHQRELDEYKKNAKMTSRPFGPTTPHRRKKTAGRSVRPVPDQETKILSVGRSKPTSQLQPLFEQQKRKLVRRTKLKRQSKEKTPFLARAVTSSSHQRPSRKRTATTKHASPGDTLEERIRARMARGRTNNKQHATFLLKF